MAANRIYKAAHEMDLTSKALMQLISDLGFEVKSHMSVYTDEMAVKVAQRLSKEKEAVKREVEKKQQIKKEAEINKEKAKPEAPVKKRRRRKRKKKKRDGKNYAAEMRRIEEERRRKREELLKTITKEKVSDSVRKTLAMLSQTKKKKKYRRQTEESVEETQDPNLLKIHEFLTTQELSKRLEVPPAELIGKCFKELDLMITLNQRLDFDTISLIVEAYEKKAEKIEIAEDFLIDEEEDDENLLRPRPPVVTVMGHVDHGKTTLLDHIRSSSIVAGEMGGITQHIGAYTVETEYGSITFIDTPGHKAFTAMRARGTQITDIVVLIVDWKDGVMPQTVEAINHARSAGVPIIIAFNKMDQSGASSDQVMQQLADIELVCDQWGGDILCVEISAKTGKNIETFIEYIILQSEVLELKANPDKPARGVILEARLERGRGPVASVIIQNGTLRKGDPIIVGVYSGKIRNMFDERGHTVLEGRPGYPVQIMGFNGIPEAGDQFFVVDSEKQAAELASQRRIVREQQQRYRVQKITLHDFFRQVKEKDIKNLRIVLKGDVDGSVKAISDMLHHLSTEEVGVDIVHRGVGQITENDILLASAVDAVVIGFNVKPDVRAKVVLLKEGLEFRFYDVIYDLEEDIKKALEGMLVPKVHEEFLGKAEILKVFKISQIGLIAGSMVTDGVLRRSADIRIIRDGEIAGEGKISELRRFKDQVKEVIVGLECGIQIEGTRDFAEGDEIECFERIEVKQIL